MKILSRKPEDRESCNREPGSGESGGMKLAGREPGNLKSGSAKTIGRKSQKGAILSFRGKKSIMAKYLVPAVIIIPSALFLFPVLASITGSFMTMTEIGRRFSSAYGNAITLVPDRITLGQYYELLIEKFKYLNMFRNSVKLTVIITVFHVVIAVPTAYVFAKVDFKGRDILFFVYIVVMMMPFQVTLLPVYIQARFLKTFDTWLAIILPGIFAPFGVFLMRQFMKYMPDEFLEAVALESNSIWDMFRIAMLPASKPGIIALSVLTFAENWNMVEQPIVLLDDQLKYPLSIALNSIIQQSSSVAFAGSVLYMSPVIILYFYFEEQIISGFSNMKF